jgi:diguanylate cyclase (GGDEF)-like protein
MAMEAVALKLDAPKASGVPNTKEALLTLIDVIETLRTQLRDTEMRLEDARDLADRDPLLPALNRRAFTRELTRHIDYCERYKTPACVVFFDLDNFKRVNDALGHAAGDAVLQHFAATLTANIRTSDIIGRLGGDEFAVLMPHASLETAQIKIITLAAILNGGPARWNDEPVAISFSAGATEITADDTPKTVLHRADKAMYASKRNRPAAATGSAARVFQLPRRK